MGETRDAGSIKHACIDSVAWTGSVAVPELDAPDTLELLSLEPKPTDETLPVVFGQTEALDVLTQMVRDVLRTAAQPNRFRDSPKTGVFALFGRYGQGKTTLLKRLRERIDDHRLDGSARFRRLRVREFDVATHNPEKLNYEFDRLIADWRTRWRLLATVGGLAIVVLVWASFGMPTSLPHEPGKAAAVATTKAAVTVTATSFDIWAAFAVGAAVVAALWSFVGPVIRAIAREEEVSRRRLARAWNYGRGDLLLQVLADVVKGPPDLLIVDNLDRAVPDQQRAFLLALRRHRDFLPPAVVVAFDETPLTLSDANPDTPQELLSKAFTSAVRLYPMTRNDAAVLVIDLLDQLYRRDDQARRYPLRHLRHVHVAGDLARILLFHRRHSVRFCRQFVNIVATAALTLGIDNPGDFSALMRLHGLFEFLPWIRSDPVALGDMLEREDTDSLLAYAASLAGKTELSAETVESVTAFLRGTRHMQPVYDGWRAFIGRFGEKPRRTPGLPDDTSLLVWDAANGKSELRDAWIRTDLKLADEPRPDLRAREYRERLMRGPPPLDEVQHTLPDRLTYAYLVHRLWQADADFLKQRDTHSALYETTNRLDRPYWLAPLPEAPGEEPEPAVADVFARLFLQIAWPLPPEVLGLYAGAVAAASVVGRDRGESGVTLWLERLLRRGDERVPVFLMQFGRHLGTPSGDGRGPFFGLVVDCLPDLPVYQDDGDTIDWEMARKVTDLLGRILRDGHDGALRPVRPLIDKVLASESGDPAALRQLMGCVAAGLPLPGGEADGPWRQGAVEELARLFDPARRPDSATGPFMTALEQICTEPAAGNLLLLALAAEDAAAVAKITMCWNPPLNPRESYLAMREACAHRFQHRHWPS